MFPGCPSVRPDLRPDFFVYAITQVLLNGNFIKLGTGVHHQEQMN